MRVTVEIPDEIHAKLKARAWREGETMRAIVARAVEAELRRDSPRSLFDREERMEPAPARSGRFGSLRLGDDGVYEYVETS